jgi:hypothetical protein
MRILTTALALLAALTATAHAQEGGFRPVTDEQAFVSTVAHKNLRLPMFNVALEVKANGTIVGEAMGKPITGSWEWDNGTFCRTMTWGAKPVAHNCQLVEVAEGKVRFTLDGGAGDSAVFRMH